MGCLDRCRVPGDLVRNTPLTRSRFVGGVFPTGGREDTEGSVPLSPWD